MFGISLPELLVIGIVCLVVFGPEKLPELARTLGQLTSQFRKSSDSIKREFYREVYPPLPDNPLSQARRELETVRDDVKATFTGAPFLKVPPQERWSNCETEAAAEAAAKIAADSKTGIKAQFDSPKLQGAPELPQIESETTTEAKITPLVCPPGTN